LASFRHHRLEHCRCFLDLFVGISLGRRDRHEPVQIGMYQPKHLPARCAASAWLGAELLAEQQLAQPESESLLAHATGPGDQQYLRQSAGCDGTAKLCAHGGMTGHWGEAHAEEFSRVDPKKKGLTTRPKSFFHNALGAPFDA
jgi:hypothetical protein